MGDQRGGPPSVRVSDADREAAADALREHCGQGRLTLDEMSERMGAVFAATTRAELDGLLADLPAIPAPVLSPTGAPGVARRLTGWTVSVMGSSSRRGRWRPKPTSNVVTLMGSAELDLRQADVEGGDLVINAVSLMGSVDVIVPEGMEVELTGIPLMGSKDLRVRPGPPVPGAPRVHVRAFPIMGSVMVRSKRSPDGENPGPALGDGRRDSRPARPPGLPYGRVGRLEGDPGGPRAADWAERLEDGAERASERLEDRHHRRRPRW